MKKRIYNVLISVMFSLLVLACYDDKGSYDYVEISKIKITNLEEVYSKVAFRDTLHVEAIVESDNPTDEFDYLWTLNVTPILGVDNKNIKLDTIGNERILNFPVNINQGFYELVLWVTNKSNGMKIFKDVSLDIVTEFSEGFYLLKDMGNSTDIDLHMWDHSNITNIIQKIDGHPMLESPIGLGLDPEYCYIDEESGENIIVKMLAICTDNDVRMMNVENMKTIFTHKTMFYSDNIPSEKPYHIWRNLYGVGYMSDLGVYFSAQAYSFDMFGSGKFGFPSTYEEEETHPSKHGVYVGFYYFFFDELGHRFLYLDYNGHINKINDNVKNSTETEKFTPNEIQYKLKFFGKNVTSKKTTGYALFEDENIVDKHYLYTMALGEVPYNPIKKVKEIDPFSKLNTATLYASNELKAKAIYFVNDNELYVYDPELDIEENFIPEGLERDEEITYISNRYWTGSDNKFHNFDYLVIATFKAGKYKVYLYETLGSKTDGEPKYIFEGDGKIVKMHYVSPYMNLNNYSDFPGSF